MEKALVVMAAGMGSRFGGLKQIEPVGPNGEFIVDYSVYDAKRAGFTKVVFIIKKELLDTFKKTIGTRLEKEIKVEYAFQDINDIPEEKKYLAKVREKPWGTAQAVMSARDLVNDSFVVINADDFYGYDAYLKASKFLDESKIDNEYACISYPINKTISKFGSVKRGVCFIKDDEIVKMVESSVTLEGNQVKAVPLNGSDVFTVELNHPVSMNMFAFKKGFFNYLEEYLQDYFLKDEEFILKNEALLPEAIRQNLDRKKIVLKNLVAQSEWMGITYKEDLQDLKNKINILIEKGEYPKKLWNNDGRD